MGLELTGERQVATDIDQIANDHRLRYEFAADYLENVILFDAALATILDASCGNGYGSYIIAANTGSSVVGVDISQDAIDCAKENYSIPGLTEFRKCDFVAQQLPGDKYDCAVCFETIEHMHEPGILLEKLAEVSSRLVCSVPNEDIAPYDHNRFPFHFRHYTPEQLEELLNNSGWSVVEWYTQYSKQVGEVFEADDGKTLVVVAERDVQ